MFELNKDLEVKEDSLLGSKIYTVDNFYKDPEEVSDYLFNRKVPLWKNKERPSYNGLYLMIEGLYKLILDYMMLISF